MRCVWFYLTIKRNGTPQTRLEHNAFNACFVLAWGRLLSKCSHDHENLQLCFPPPAHRSDPSHIPLHPPTQPQHTPKSHGRWPWQQQHQQQQRWRQCQCQR